MRTLFTSAAIALTGCRKWLVEMPAAANPPALHSSSLRFIVSSSFRNAVSKHESERKLDLAGRIGLAAYYAQGVVAEGRPRTAEPNVIGEIKRLSPKLHVVLTIMSKVRVLEDAEIEIVRALRANVGRGAGTGAVSEWGGLAEGA